MAMFEQNVDTWADKNIIFNTQEGLRHFHVEGLPKYLVEGNGRL